MRARLVPVALLVALLLAPAGCAPVPTPEGPMTITFLCMQQAPPEAVRPLADAFMAEHPDITVRLISLVEVLDRELSYVTPDLITKLASSADAFTWFSDSVHYPFSPEGVVLPLDPLMDAEGRAALADFPAAALDLFRRDGQLYGLPRDLDPLVVYYDPAAFDEAGLQRPRIGWTWDEFLQDAVALTRRDGEQVTRYGFADPFSYLTITALATERTGRLIDAERQPPELYLDDPGVGETLAWYTDLWRQHGVMPQPSDARVVVDRLQAAMWVDQAYNWPNNNLRGFRAAPLPENGGAGGALFAAGYYISAGSAHPEAAWQWIEFLSRQPLSMEATLVMPPRGAADWLQWRALDAEGQEVLRYVVDHAQGYRGAVIEGLVASHRAYREGASLAEALALGQSVGEQVLAEEAAAFGAMATVAPLPTVTPMPTLAADAVRFRLVTAADRPAYEAIVARYADAHPGEAAPLLSAERGAGWGGTGDADCFIYPAAPMRRLGTAGLRPLDSYLEMSGLDLSGYAPGTAAEAQQDGHTWGLPLGIDPQLLYYNRARFDAAGIAYPTSQWTVDDFVAAATKLSDPSVPTYGFYPRDGAYRHVAAYLAWFGAVPFGADGTPAFADPTVAAAMTRYADLVRTTMPPAATEPEALFGDDTVVVGGPQPAPVADGSVAMWLDHPYNQAHSTPLSFATGVAPIPRGAVPITGLSTRAMYISVGARDPDACWAFMTYAVEQPEATALLPANVAVAESDAWAEAVGEEVASAWRTTIGRGVAPAVDDPIATPAAYWLAEALADVLDGAAPEQALAQAQAHASAYATCMQGVETSQRWDQATQQACARQADPDVRLAE